MSGLRTITTMSLAALVSIPVWSQGGDEAGAPEDRGARFWERISQHMDADADGQITREEFNRAERGFERLDTNADGLLTAEDFENFQGLDRAGRHGARCGPGGMADHQPGSMLVALADVDGNGEVPFGEWEEFLGTLDADADGIVTGEEFAQVAPRPMHGGRGGRGERRGGWESLEGRPSHPDRRPSRHGDHLVRLLDQNEDGALQVDELGVLFDQLDSNDDQLVDAEELPRPRRSHDRRMARPGSGFGG